MLSPIQSQPIPKHRSIAFGGDENERHDSLIDLTNLTVDVDHANKQILVDVSMSLAQNLHQNADESLNASTCSAIGDVTFTKTPDSTRLTRNSINTSKSASETNSNRFESPEATHDDSVQLNITAAAEYLSFHRDRTPIGVIRLRKVTPQVETPEISISDDEEYEIVVVNNGHMHAQQFDSVNSTMDESDENPPAAYHPIIPTNSAIASKSTAKAHPFAFSPRIILNRINSIDEYQQNLTIQETPKTMISRKSDKRKPRQTKAARTKNGTIFIRIPLISFVVKSKMEIATKTIQNNFNHFYCNLPN